MNKHTPTADEMISKAKDGYFWEINLKTWIHRSQVSTEAIARNYLKRKNPFRVNMLANMVGDSVAERLTGFTSYVFHRFIRITFWYLVVTLIAYFALKLTDTSFIEARETYPIAYGLWGTVTLLQGSFIMRMLYLLRRYDLDDGAFALAKQAEMLNEGYVFDYSTGEWLEV